MSDISVVLVCPHCDETFPIDGKQPIDAARTHVMAHVDELEAAKAAKVQVALQWTDDPEADR
jgi:hypothetical protein